MTAKAVNKNAIMSQSPLFSSSPPLPPPVVISFKGLNYCQKNIFCQEDFFFRVICCCANGLNCCCFIQWAFLLSSLFLEIIRI